EDGCPWWEGIDGPVPERLTDWRGRPWQKGSSEKAAHPNSRFTAPAAQCPSISPEFDDPQGVPISALVFGGRRARTAPLVLPGFGENMRVLRWIVARAKGAGAATESPIGMLPAPGAIDTSGLAVDGRTMEELLSVSSDDWRREAAGIGEFFGKFDGRLPAEMERQRQGLVKRLG